MQCRRDSGLGNHSHALSGYSNLPNIGIDANAAEHCTRNAQNSLKEKEIRNPPSAGTRRANGSNNLHRKLGEHVGQALERVQASKNMQILRLLRCRNMLVPNGVYSATHTTYQEGRIAPGCVRKLRHHTDMLRQHRSTPCVEMDASMLASTLETVNLH